MIHQVELLYPADVPENVALSSGVGWTDVSSDWRVLHGAGLVVGIREQGRLIAQGVLGDFGRSGTIAKIVVAPDRQRRGLGRTILVHLLEQAAVRGIDTLGLVATEQGRSLYEENKFRAVGEIVVFTGVPRRSGLASRATPTVKVEAALALDASWLGCCRRNMLVWRYREAIASFVSTDLDGEPTGYGMATMQACVAVIGPIVSSTDVGAQDVAAAIFRAVPGKVRIDVPAAQLQFRSWLRHVGLVEHNRRIEMARGAEALPWNRSQRFALATQAWG